MHESSADVAVFVPGIDAPSTVACLRSLRPRGIRTIVGSETATTPGAVSRYCDEFVRLPDPGEDLAAYGDALLSVARRPDVKTIVPVREEDVYTLARHRETFAASIATPWPTFETLRTVQDRIELFEAADRAGVAAPETALLDEWDDWDRETIVKPRYSVATPEYLGPTYDRVAVGSTAYQTPGTPPNAAAEIERRGHVPLVQERVADSREYGFFALYDRGEAVATFQHCQRRGWEYCGGPSAYRESIYLPELEADGRALLDELEWHGLAMVEFLRDPTTGEFKLMEINPRFWSSLPFTVQAGADFPFYYWQLAVDEPIPGNPTYETGLGGHLLRGELSYLHSVLAEEYPAVERPSPWRAARDVGLSLVRQPRFDYAVRDDPLPFLRDGLNVLREWVEDWTADPDGELPAGFDADGRVPDDGDPADAPGGVTAE
ncbi:carboxylate--amine ligase [Natronococcus occultus]|uniref:Putative ATP-grasp enzyme n=1 Tax=Natronococcus occultus SP4 TaxID=694430 RepID=L0JUU4_9EURY|nr:ATP-grasp enzyme [Natronococcus occultus]AGB36536.1 putative ATP-grasp enzyme [Natronococcus occultus SP4]